jgi:hypothetical protein
MNAVEIEQGQFGIDPPALRRGRVPLRLSGCLRQQEDPVKPREWFLVPLHVVDEAVKRILDGSIAEVVYSPEAARLVSRQ